jgi:surface polysaccharide O-acyltransferase-like enzyme
MNKKENVFSVELLRVVSIAAVVLIHTTTRVLEFTKYDLNGFPFALFLNQAARFAVPMFFLISGFVLEHGYHHNENFLVFFKKRVDKILLPYLFWSFIYYFFVYKEHSMNFAEALISGNSSYQLYFIPTLIIFYFFFPLIHGMFRFLSKWYVLILLGILEIWLLNQDYFVNNITLPYPVSVVFFNFYIFLLGMVGSHHRKKIKIVLEEIKYLLIFGSVALAFYLYNQGKFIYYLTYNINAFYSQWRPLVLAYTIVVSGVLLYIYSKRSVNHYTIKKLARYSLFVFFVHTLIIEIVWKYFGVDFFGILRNNFIGRIIFDVAFFGVVTYFSFFFAYLSHKIPKLFKITG